jgi:hypothetical protein
MRDTETQNGEGLDSDAYGSNPFTPRGAEIGRVERPAPLGLSIYGYSVEGIAYLTALAGIVSDHLSTRVGLLCPRIRELNPFTVFLRQKGLWLPFDVLLLFVSLGLPALLMRKWRFRGRWAILAFPVLFGLARLFAAMHNVIMIIQYF